MQGKDDIIELNGVHAPRVPMKVLILQERKEEGEGPGRWKGRASMDYQYTSRMGTASHVPRPMCYWWAEVRRVVKTTADLRQGRKSCSFCAYITD